MTNSQVRAAAGRVVEPVTAPEESRQRAELAVAVSAHLAAVRPRLAAPRLQAEQRHRVATKEVVERHQQANVMTRCAAATARERKDATAPGSASLLCSA